MMKCHLYLLPFLALLIAPSAWAATIPNPSEILSSSPCNYIESSNTVDCSGVASVSEITAAMEELEDAGATEFMEFALIGNYQVSHLPQGLLGNVKFQAITINNNHNLYSAGDILGASKDSVKMVDMSGNHLSYIPRMESTSLEVYKQSGNHLSSISDIALNALPNLQVLELQNTGFSYESGLEITDGAFENLRSLQVLNLTDYKPTNFGVKKGSFVFSSPNLRVVDLRKTVFSTAETGSFGALNPDATVYMYLNRIINFDTFYDVFSSGANVVTTEPQPCGCDLEWLFLSSYKPQAHMTCVYRGEYYSFQDLPEDAFSFCSFE